MSDHKSQIEKARREALDEAWREAWKAIDALLHDEQLPDGRYFHHPICSGNYHKPIGAPGCACRAFPILRRFREEGRRERSRWNFWSRLRLFK